MVDFDTKKIEAKKAIQLLISYCSSIGWADFGDKGNACWKPYNATQMEIEEIEVWHGAIRSTLKKGCSTFVLLEQLVKLYPLSRTFLKLEFPIVGHLSFA